MASEVTDEFVKDENKGILKTAFLGFCPRPALEIRRGFSENALNIDGIRLE